MLTLLFEVTPKPGRTDEYLEIAAALRPDLDASGGCLALDRYRNLARDGSLLSYQIWRDEASLVRWRVHGEHHKAQLRGRTSVFADYRLRVAQIVHDEAAGAEPWRPTRLSAYHDPQQQAPRYVLIVETAAAAIEPGAPALAESFASLYRAGEHLHLLEAPDIDTGVAMGRRALAAGAPSRFRVAEIERDYGMSVRGEAPQFFAPARAPGA